MLYKIADGREVNIDTGALVSLIDDYAKEFPGFFPVVDQNETYLTLDLSAIKPELIIAFDPSFILDVRLDTEIATEVLTPQVVAVIQKELPGILASVIDEKIKELVTPEAIAVLAKDMLEKQIKTQMAEILMTVATLINKNG